MTLTVIQKAQSYREILAVADRLTPTFRRAFLNALDAATRGLDTESERRLLWGDPRVWQEFEARLEPALREAVQRAVLGAGQVALEGQPDSVGIQMRFDLGNPHAVDAVDTVVAESLGQIVNANQDMVRTIVRRGFLYGLPPATMSRRIRDYIGLTARDVTAVENYRASVLGTETSPLRADELASQYARRLVNQRATTIARTETIRAANAGQQAAWLDVQGQGLLQGGVRQQWIVTEDDRLCPLCEAIPDLNPEGKKLGERFASPVGSLSGPPAHPACRCALVLVNP